MKLLLIAALVLVVPFTSALAEAASIKRGKTDIGSILPRPSALQNFIAK